MYKCINLYRLILDFVIGKSGKRVDRGITIIN